MKTRRSTVHDVTLWELVMLAVLPVARHITRYRLQRRLRALERIADHFTREAEHARFAVAEVQREIAIARSDLRNI